MRHLALILLVLCAGCSVEKKMARDEAKAAAILAQAQIKAAKLCPWCIFQDSVTTKADSARIPLAYAADLNPTSLDTACAQYIEALQAERDLYIHALATYTPDTVLVSVPDTIRVPVASLSPKARKAVEAIRSSVCQFEPLVYESDAVRVEVRPGAAVPLLSVEEKERKLACPPCVAKVVYKEAPRVKQWGWIGLSVGLVFGFGIALFIMGAFRKA